MINWKPEGKKNEAVPNELGKMGYIQRWVRDGIYTAMGERELRMGEWSNRRQWNMVVGRHHQTF